MIYYFEDYALDTERRELRRGTIVLPLEPQVFDLLAHLIRNRDSVLSRDDVFRAIWNSRIVSDSSLSTRLNAARRAIGDSGAEQRLIRTLPKKGIRFVGEVREAKNAPDISAGTVLQKQPVAASFSDRPGIAVLPFINMSGEPRHEVLADAMTEELITALSKAGWFFVISRNSSFAFKGRAMEMSQLARRLGVRYLLEGSLQLTADRMRVTARLIDGISDHNLWAERYDRQITDLLAIQDDIADKVVGAIEPQLYAAEDIRAKRKTARNLNAWECIVRALSLMGSRKKPHIVAARTLLQRAALIDPKSAAAQSLLSFVTTLNVHMGWKTRQSVVPVALSAAQTALTLNSDEPWAHAALGYAMIWRQPEDALLPLQRAIALNPNFAVAHYLTALASTYAGEKRNIFAHADMAERLAPRDLLARGYVGAHHNVRATACFAQGRFRDGAAFARMAIAESPNSPTAYRAFVMNLALGGEVEEAKEALKTLKRLAPDMSQRRLKETGMWTDAEETKKYAEAFRMAGLE